MGDRMCGFFSIDSDDSTRLGEFDEGNIVFLSESGVDEVARRARVDKSLDLIRDSFNRGIPDRRAA